MQWSKRRKQVPTRNKTSNKTAHVCYMPRSFKLWIQSFFTISWARPLRKSMQVTTLPRANVWNRCEMHVNCMWNILSMWNSVRLNTWKNSVKKTVFFYRVKNACEKWGVIFFVVSHVKISVKCVNFFLSLNHVEMCGNIPIKNASIHIRQVFHKQLAHWDLTSAPFIEISLPKLKFLCQKFRFFFKFTIC